MESRKKNEGNEKIIHATKERLKWYATAPIEEFDENDVEMLVNILNSLEPPKVQTEQEKKAELDHFRTYYKMRMAEGGFMDEETIEKITGEAVSSYDGVEEQAIGREAQAIRKKSEKKKTLFAFMRAHKLVSAVAIVCLLILVVSGSFGVVNAEKNGGFFHWLSRDDEGVTMVTSPEDMGSGINAIVEQKYDSIADVPEQYLKYLVEIDEFDTLCDYKLQAVKVRKSDLACIISQTIRREYNDTGMVLGVKIYINEATLLKENYLSEGNYNEMIGEEFLVKENEEQQEEYTILFYYGNKQYFIEGNCGKEEFMKIAAEYKEIIEVFEK